MVEVRITGWRPGLDKVAMTKSIQEYARKDLSAAKACTDSVLAGDEVSLFLAEQLSAAKLAAALTALGADVEVLQ